jgi:hypothetical protein
VSPTLLYGYANEVTRRIGSCYPIGLPKKEDRTRETSAVIGPVIAHCMIGLTILHVHSNKAALTIHAQYGLYQV